MHDQLLAEVTAVSADDMKALGHRLGHLLETGDVVGLVGPLGAGKTTLTQGIAQGAGVSPDRNVASPTFALVNEHPGRAVSLVHADLYRIADPAELLELGLDDACDRAAVVIEWLDRFPTAAPEDHLRVTIEMAPDGARHLRAQALGPRARRLLAAFVSPP